jgi:hypothetical protein
MDRTPNVDAISLDNIDVLSKWRVESEMPIMEEAPAWLDEEPKQQQALEEQKERRNRRSVKILCNCKEYSYPLLWIKIKYIYY